MTSLYFPLDFGFIGNAIQRVKDNISYTFQENVNAISKYHNPEQRSTENGCQQYNDKEKSLINRPSKAFNLFGGKSEAPKSGEGRYIAFFITYFKQIVCSEEFKIALTNGLIVAD